MKCKCHPNSFFHWAHNKRDSTFVKDVTFRPKAAQTYAHLTPAENLVAYKAFSIHSRAHPKTKPSLNKHEMPNLQRMDTHTRDTNR
jgi:hypothetical protein